MNLCISKPWLAPSACSSKCVPTWPTSISLAVGLLVAVSPVALEGQGSGPLRENWSVGLASGVFNYEPSLDQGFPIFAARADRPVSRWVRLEVGTTYTRPEVQLDDQQMFDPSLPAEHTNLFTITVGVQARWSVGPLEPYGGLSIGWFARYDADSAGRRFSRSTIGIPFGIRFWVTDHIGIRGEYRFDEDNHELVAHSDSEKTVGVFWTF